MKAKATSSAATFDVPGRHTAILRHGEELNTVRHLDSSASPVSVFAGPSSKVRELIEFGGLDGRPLAYLHCSSTSPSAYIGHSGNGERRLGEQVKARPHFDELYVVSFKDPSTGMKPARYAEARFIQLADAAGTKLDNVDRPTPPEMTEPERADHERLLFESLFPLYDAGCRILEKRPVPTKKKNCKDELVDAQVVFGPIKIPLNAPAFELKAKKGQWARGFAVGNRFYVMPGADYALKATKSLTSPIVIRRTVLEKQKILAPIKGVKDRKRLVAWLDCGSDAIAAKVLTGWQVNSKVWRKTPRCPLVHVVKDFVTSGGKRR
jgi:hypothetical protein